MINGFTTKTIAFSRKPGASPQGAYAPRSESLAGDLRLNGYLFLVVSVFSVLSAGQRVGEPETIFTLHTASGVVRHGPLAKIGPDWTVRLGGSKPVLIRGQDVISLRQQAVRLPCPPEGPQVILADGSRLPFDAAAGLHLGGERLSFTPQPPLRPAEGDQLRVPLSQVAILWLTNPNSAVGPARRLRQLLRTQRRRDQVLLCGGDVVEGTVLALGPAGCRIKIGPTEQAVPLARLAAIAFSTELLARPQPKKTYGHLVCTGGGRLELSTASVDAERRLLKGETLFGAEVLAPLQAVAALDLRQGRAVYLSDLKPLDYVCNPFLGISWPLTPDAGTAGGPLRIGGNCYDKGLGMHAESRVTYDLAGKYDWLEAVVGLDDQIGRQGRVRIEVQVDGRPQALPAAVLTFGRAVSFRVDVHKARQLTLLVHFAGRGDVQAHVFWADARLVRAP
jgi:hypothetical protein